MITPPSCPPCPPTSPSFDRRDELLELSDLVDKLDARYEEFCLGNQTQSNLLEQEEMKLVEKSQINEFMKVLTEKYEQTLSEQQLNAFDYVQRLLPAFLKELSLKCDENQANKSIRSYIKQHLWMTFQKLTVKYEDYKDKTAAIKECELQLYLRLEHAAMRNRQFQGGDRCFDPVKKKELKVIQSLVSKILFLRGLQGKLDEYLTPIILKHYSKILPKTLMAIYPHFEETPPDILNSSSASSSSSSSTAEDSGESKSPIDCSNESNDDGGMDIDSQSVSTISTSGSSSSVPPHHFSPSSSTLSSQFRSEISSPKSSSSQQQQQQQWDERDLFSNRYPSNPPSGHPPERRRSRRTANSLIHSSAVSRLGLDVIPARQRSHWLSRSSREGSFLMIPAPNSSKNKKRKRPKSLGALPSNPFGVAVPSASRKEPARQESLSGDSDCVMRESPVLAPESPIVSPTPTTIDQQMLPESPTSGDEHLMVPSTPPPPHLAVPAHSYFSPPQRNRTEISSSSMQISPFQLKLTEIEESPVKRSRRTTPRD